MMNKEAKKSYVEEMKKNFSSSCFESSAASTTVSVESSSIILFKSAILFPMN